MKMLDFPLEFLREVADLKPGKVLKFEGLGDVPDFTVIATADLEHILDLAELQAKARG